MRYAEKHMDYINKYNKIIREQLLKAMKYHGISPDAIEPETIEGIKKCLGQWDFDGHYSSYKTLGAKRYLARYSTDPRNKKKEWLKYNLTVSGLNKKKCVPYLLKKYGKRGIFNAFTNNLYIPPEHTGKNTHTYIDEPRAGVVVDYLGTPGEYKELSGVHLEKCDYSLSISREYLDYILKVDTVYY